MATPHIEHRDEGRPASRADRELSLSARWAAALEAFFERRNDALPAFLALYDPSIHFEDPVHSIDGLAAFAEMNRRFAAKARLLHIKITDVAEGEGSFLAAWTMEFAPRLLPRMVMHGATLARVAAGKIVYQRDHFDPVGGFAHAVPGVSFLYRVLIRSMA